MANSASFVMIAPPSPQLRFLLARKLKQPASPQLPTIRPRHSARCVLAGVFDDGDAMLFERAQILSMSATLPPICTGKIARVFGVIAAAILSASIWEVSRSTST